MEEKKYLNLGNKIAYGFGNGGMMFIYTIINSFILIFITDAVGLNPGIVGTLMLVAKIADGISDILFGGIINKTRTRFGKAKPWILAGMIPLGVCLVLNFAVPNIAPQLQYAYFFVFYVLFNAVCYTIVGIAVNTYSFYITKNNQERIQLGSSGYIIGTVIQMACASFTMTLVNAFGGGVAAWRNTALIFAVLGIASLALCALGNKEIPESESNTMDNTPNAKSDITFFEGIKYLFRNKYFFIMVAALIVFNTIVTAMMTTAPYYAKYILKNENLNGIITMIILLPVVISMLFTPMLTKKFGLYKVNKNGYWTSFILSILCLIFALKGFTLPLFITMFLRSLGMGPFAGTQNAIVAQLCEYSERKDHVHIEGFLFSCTSFGIKVGGGIAATLVGWALSAGGYVGTASTQSSGALTAIILVFAGIPAILTIVNAALLSALKVEKANADLKSND